MVVNTLKLLKFQCVQMALEVFAGLTMTYDQIQALAAERTDAHPLLQLSCLADLDRRDPLEAEEHDYGTWDLHSSTYVVFDFRRCESCISQGRPLCEPRALFDQDQ